jgi:hypothetical protein
MVNNRALGAYHETNQSARTSAWSVPIESGIASDSE